MFSTPQSRAFFSQEIMKEKLITQQISLTSIVHEKVWEVKALITSIIKILWQPEYQLSETEKKFKNVIQILQNNVRRVSESNQMFLFEVSLRGDIKQLEHHFFKYVMHLYEQKIKQLKKSLLSLEHDVQQLEQIGHLPYIETPKKNYILICKAKFYEEYIHKVDTIEKIVGYNKKGSLQMLIISLINDILSRKQTVVSNQEEELEALQNYPKYDQNGKEILDVSEYIEEQGSEKIKSQILTFQENYHEHKKSNMKLDIYEMLKMLHNWVTISNFKIKNVKKTLKSKIEALNNSNRVLKQSISNYKKIINYEQQQAKVRQGCIELTREEAIDFLREMDEDLQNRFSRRNIYMIISNDQVQKNSKTCTHLPQDQDGNTRRNIKEIDANLNDSFLEKCGYLISDTFIADDNDDNQIVMV